MWKNREKAFALLSEYTKSEALIRHALSVECAMRAYAAKLGEDVEAWGTVGLLHDFDYEAYPTAEEHPYVGASILREKGFPEEAVLAVLGHAEYTGTPRETMMAKTLFAVDELCGFLLACAYVRPDRSMAQVEYSSIKKKLKDKAFARGVNRDDIEKGIEEMGVDREEHILFVRDALAKEAAALGLAS